jgi:tetratricopeptide (TPR) repeat protein
LQSLDGALTQVGRTDPSLLERALALVEENDDLPGLGRVLNSLGINAYYAGQWTEALEFYRRGVEAKQRAGDLEGATMSIHNRAEILSNQGRYDEAQELFREALRAARASGLRMVVGYVTMNLGRLAARTTRFEEAHAMFDSAGETLRSTGSRSFVFETHVLRIECLVFEGRHREALERAATALDRAASLGQLELRGPTIERSIGYALCQDRRPQEAVPHFERSLELARAAGARYDIALTLRAIAETRGETSAEADDLFRQLGVVALPSVPLP